MEAIMGELQEMRAAIQSIHEGRKKEDFPLGQQ